MNGNFKDMPAQELRGIMIAIGERIALIPELDDMHASTRQGRRGVRLVFNEQRKKQRAYLIAQDNGQKPHSPLKSAEQEIVVSPSDFADAIVAKAVQQLPRDSRHRSIDHGC